MSKFSLVAAGIAATTTKQIEFLGGAIDKVIVRVLSGEEEAEIVSFAKRYATEKGASDSSDLFSLAAMAFRVSLSFMDVEDPKTPYFGGVTDVLSSPLIGKERIESFAELQDIWQDECSPGLLRLSVDEFNSRIEEIARSATPDPFVELRPGLRWILFRSTVVELLILRRLKSPSGSPSEGTTSTSSLQ